MSQDNTPNFAQANEDAYNGRATHDPYDYAAVAYNNKILQAFYTAYEWMNEILALGRSRVANAQYQQTYACLAGLAVGDAVYLSANNAVALAKADTVAHSQVCGFVRYKPTTTTCLISHFRYSAGFTGATAGNPVYLQDAGNGGTATGTKSKVIGTFISATEAILATNPSDAQAAALGFIKADGSVAFTGNQSLGSHKLTNVTDPTSAQDAATKNYVDSIGPIQGYSILEDFIGVVPSPPSVGSTGGGVFGLSDLSSGTAAAVLGGNCLDATSPGTIEFQTGSTNAGVAWVSSLNYAVVLGGYAFSQEFRYWIDTLSDGANRFITRIGLGDGSSTPGAEGIWFEQADNANSGKWQAKTMHGSVTTPNDTGIAAVAGSWVKFKYAINAAGTQVLFYINGVLVATHTTNIPIGTPGLVMFISVTKSAGTTDRDSWCDYILHQSGAISR